MKRISRLAAGGKFRAETTGDLSELLLATALLVGLAASSPRPAQAQAERAEEIAGEAEAEDDQEAQPKSLDELLGLEKEEDDTAGVAEREAQDELQRRLTQQEINDAFSEAVLKMSISAAQLDQRFDSGLGTQRVQEEVLAKLTQLIEEAKKQQSSGSSSSSSSSSSSAQSQPKPQPGKRGAEAEGQRSEGSSSDSSATDAPPLREGEVNAVLEESRTEWGSLPQRVRDQLIQGRRGKISSLYEQLTQEYYRRLAEEASSP